MEIFETDNSILDKPEFEQATRIHDWRNYVPDELIAIWGSLSLRERQIIYFMANEQSDAEEWD